jgi:hypothetical protein
VCFVEYGICPVVRGGCVPRAFVILFTVVSLVEIDMSSWCFRNMAHPKRLPLHSTNRIGARDSKLFRRMCEHIAANGLRRCLCPCRICNKGLQSNLLVSTIFIYLHKYGRHPRQRGHNKGFLLDESDDKWEDHIVREYGAADPRIPTAHHVVEEGCLEFRAYLLETFGIAAIENLLDMHVNDASKLEDLSDSEDEVFQAVADADIPSQAGKLKNLATMRNHFFPPMMTRILVI